MKKLLALLFLLPGVLQAASNTYFVGTASVTQTDNALGLVVISTKSIVLNDVDNSNYVGIRASNTVSGNAIYVWPSADGTAGQIMATDGNKNLYFTTAGAGSGDMVLASTQTSSGAKAWNSYSNFRGSVTFHNIAGFQGTVISTNGYFTSTGTITSTSGGFSTTSGSLVAGSASDISTFGPTGVGINYSVSGQQSIRSADTSARSTTVPTRNASIYTYTPSDEAVFSGGAYFGLFESSATLPNRQAFAVIGSGNQSLTTGVTDYLRINVSTSGPAGAVETLQGTLPQRVMGSIFTMMVSSTISNTSSEINVVNTGTGTITIPPGFWEPGRNIVIKAAGIYTTTTTPGSFTFKLKFGTTIIVSTASFPLVDNQTNQLWSFGITLAIRSIGASGTLVGNSALVMFDTTNGMRAFPTYMLAPVTLNMTTSQDTGITAQFGTANTNNQFTTGNFSVFAQ